MDGSSHLSSHLHPLVWRSLASMEGLLHWDFSPGQAVEAQVRARFGSIVHFHQLLRPRNSFWLWPSLLPRFLWLKNKWDLLYNVVLVDRSMVFMLNIWLADTFDSLSLPIKWGISYMGVRIAFGQISFVISIFIVTTLGISLWRTLHGIQTRSSMRYLYAPLWLSNLILLFCKLIVLQKS